MSTITNSGTSDSVVTGQLRTAGGLGATLHAPAGASALVVLSHGLYLSHQCWTGVMAGLAEQIAGTRKVAVLVYDHRGHGGNAALADPAGELSIQTLATDLSQILHAAWDFVGQIPTVLVGHSLGSMVALAALAEQMIDRTALVGLTLVSSSAGSLTGGALLRALPVVAGRAPGAFTCGQRLVRAALSPLSG